MSRCPSQDWDRYCDSQEGPWEGLWNTIYEKFPWVEDLHDSDTESWPAEKIQAEIETLLNWVIKEAHAAGREDARCDMGFDLGHTEVK